MVIRRLAIAVAAGAGASLLAQDPVERGADAAPPRAIAELLEAHCVDCHGGDAVKGGLDLTVPAAGAVANADRWRRVRDRVAAGEMPPPDPEALGANGPTRAERTALVAFAAAALRREVQRLPPDPGRVTVRRLSRSQWQNVVHDLFGVATGDVDFPADDLAYGFDTIGDALTFSTLHLEKHLHAASAVAAEVFHGEDPGAPARQVFAAASMHLVRDRGARSVDPAMLLLSRATLEQRVSLPRDGVYLVHVVAGATQAGDELAKLLVQLDGRDLELFEVEQRTPQPFTIRTPLSAGERRFALTFVNDHYDPKHPDPRRRDRNLLVERLEIEGPIDARPVPPQQRWLEGACEAAAHGGDVAVLRATTAALLPRLWRRPVGEHERTNIAAAAERLLQDGESLAAAQRFVLTAAMCSPHFLFRLELDRDAQQDDQAAQQDDQPAPLDGFALASRLSFLSWGSCPDERLLELAGRGELAGEDALLAELDRMLADRRSERLASEFAAQWLELRALAERTPDPQRFPGFDERLRRSLQRESELLFLAVLRDDLDVRRLLDATFTHVDARLADFYGLPFAAPAAAGGPSDEFVRVELPAALRERGGVLGHASVLTLTSNPTRTSPVKRGKWILENLLGQAPPPPPPGSDSFESEAAIDSAASLREQMALHRESAKCAVCHLRMDPLGLALERYDAIGRFRDTDGGGAIDCRGELPDGRIVDGLAGLKRVVAADPAFVRTLANKLFVYAVGRDLRPVDRLRLDVAVTDLLESGGGVTLRDLLRLVVRDVAFSHRAPAR